MTSTLTQSEVGLWTYLGNTYFAMKTVIYVGNNVGNKKI